MQVHLIDGTYELFRHHLGLPSEVAADGRSATRGVMRSVLDLIAGGATHVGVATDTVIESFRNDLWPGYKTGAGHRARAPARPVPRWWRRASPPSASPCGGCVEVEADDALATAAARAAADPAVERVVICTPDKDLAQCVVGTRVVQLDRRADAVRDEDGVWERFGVGPGVDPRLPRPGGRLGRRLPGPSRAGVPRARRPSSPATATSTRSPTTPPTGT